MPQTRPIPFALQDAIRDLLRGAVPRALPPGDLAAALKRYECGGYLHSTWSKEGGTARLPDALRAAVAEAHRRTVIDNLAALAQFRGVAAELRALGAECVLLKGAAYLAALYDDPGARLLTDIDLLVRPAAAGPIARRLAAAGYHGEIGAHYPENRRFEMWLPGAAHCRFEFHWSLGLPFRFRVDQEGLWARARAAVLEGAPCLIASPEDALLYHVAHLADHYFGHSLKWILDLREMLRRWRPDAETLVRRAHGWRVRTALHLALLHLERLFPGEAPLALAAGAAPGRLRARLLRPFLGDAPLELLDRPDSGLRRPVMRCLMLDRPADALRLAAQVALRPALRPLRRMARRSDPPWTPGFSAAAGD